MVRINFKTPMEMKVNRLVAEQFSGFVRERDEPEI
jgi:hypothetical protein